LRSVYLLDTNIVSEAIRPFPDSGVTERLREYDDSAAAMHAEIRAKAEKVGTPLSFVNGMIASIARTNNLLLVTRNTADFSAVPELHLENWFGEDTD
jgi:predicted nucleic acid-binding protein